MKPLKTNDNVDAYPDLSKVSKRIYKRMKKKKYFNRIESKILRVLYQYKISLTIYEVAKETGISYPTSKKYLKKLKKDGLIESATFKGDTQFIKKDNPKEYKFNFNVFKGEKRKKRNK